MNSFAQTIRPFHERDWPQVCAILRNIIQSGESYAFDPATRDDEIYDIWIKTPQETYVVADHISGEVLGTYYVKPNWPGLGAHVANAGYAVAEFAQGKGLASAMCEHSLIRAKELAFKAMQFNFVVSTNTRAVKLWQRHGFDTIGTLPGAFQHRKLGLVDVHIMFRKL